MSFIIFLSIFSFSFTSSIDIDLLTTNDLHGFIAEQQAYFMNPNHPPKIIGGAGLYKYINKNIDKKKSIILDGGNFFQGHPMSVIDSGKTMIEFMNKIGYTALVPGSDDFVYGSENLNELAEFSDFPFLISNIECNDCNLISDNFKTHIIKNIQGITFGFIGIVDSELDEKVASNKIDGIVIKDIKKSIDYWLGILETSCDVIIILTSSGVPYERERVYNNFISQINSGIKNDVDGYGDLNAVEMGYFSKRADIIVSGGVSKGYNLPWVDPNSDVLIMQNYGNGTSFGHIKLEILNKSFNGYEFMIKNNQSQTLLLDDFSPDFEIREWINNKNTYALNELYKEFQPDISLDIKNEFSENEETVEVSNKWRFPTLGSEEKLDIITWNCEFFPIADQETIEALSEAVYDLDVDIIAFQEIKKNGWFSRLMDLLPNYKYIISDQSSFMNQAIIYKKNQFKLIRKVEPFADNDYNFAGRPPLRADFFRYSDSNYYSIVNLHMKCCNSGLDRRKKASKMLYDYISKELNNEYSDFIILGDWNDDLKDRDGEHCFTPFLKDSRFHFVTEKIVNDLSQSTYPKEPYVSFLDHILVTNRLIPKHSTDFEVLTINMGDYMGGYDIYEKFISDHFPVLLSF